MGHVFHRAIGDDYDHHRQGRQTDYHSGQNWQEELLLEFHLSNLIFSRMRKRSHDKGDTYIPKA
jgi:hypothetical protein